MTPTIATIARHQLGIVVVAASTALLALGAALPVSAQEATVIEFTQTGCQFVESENGADHGYAPTLAEDCKAINGKTGDERLAKSKTLTLKPGKYVFRVTNTDVPYELGFYLRGDGVLARATLPSVSGGGLTPSVTREYAVTLEPGEYVYSCPLNPTPDYRLLVEG